MLSKSSKRGSLLRSIAFDTMSLCEFGTGPESECRYGGMYGHTIPLHLKLILWRSRHNCWEVGRLVGWLVGWLFWRWLVGVYGGG